MSAAVEGILATVFVTIAVLFTIINGLVMLSAPNGIGLPANVQETHVF